MSKPVVFRICQLLMLLQLLSYTDTVRSIALGAFDTIGLVGPMVRMEAVANGYSALGWATALALSFTSLAPLASRLIYALAGMMWFDVLTTWPLDMPLPDGFLYWGSAVVLIQLAIGFALERQFGYLLPAPLIGYRRYGFLLFAAIFAYSALSLGNGEFLKSEIPEIVHFPHLIANGIEATGWTAVFFLAASKSACWAARLGLFLLGMWIWDMFTTLPLMMPVPAGQGMWGPVSILVLFFALRPLLSSELYQNQVKK